MDTLFEMDVIDIQPLLEDRNKDKKKVQANLEWKLQPGCSNVSNNYILAQHMYIILSLLNANVYILLDYLFIQTVCIS